VWPWGRHLSTNKTYAQTSIYHKLSAGRMVFTLHAGSLMKPLPFRLPCPSKISLTRWLNKVGMIASSSSCTPSSVASGVDEPDLSLLCKGWSRDPETCFERILQIPQQGAIRIITLTKTSLQVPGRLPLGCRALSEGVAFAADKAGRVDS
jgi:hypothetical protein